MYTAKDFIENDISSKHLKLGWKVEVSNNRRLILKYTCINFDWKSLETLTGEEWNAFLNSPSYKTMNEKLERSKAKYKRSYFEAYDIYEMKLSAETYGLHVDIEKLVSKTIAKKSETIKNSLEKQNNDTAQT